MAFVSTEEVIEIFTEQSMKIQQLESLILKQELEIKELNEKNKSLESKSSV